jgi:hypothetical protein
MKLVIKQLYGLTHFLQITLLIVAGTYISPESFATAVIGGSMGLSQGIGPCIFSLVVLAYNINNFLPLVLHAQRWYKI